MCEAPVRAAGRRLTRTSTPPRVATAQLNAGKLGGARPSIVGNVTSKVGSVADNGSGGG